jgi:6-phosphogluconolactonase (cycloisomerase 2 family)
MLKLSRHLIAGIITTCFITACNNNSTNPQQGQDITAKINALSTDANSPGIKISNSLPNPPIVVAGQTFTITATSMNGGQGTVRFLNYNTNDEHITYSPNQCQIGAGGSCRTTVSVGLGAIPTAGQISDATKISYSGTNFITLGNIIPFGIISPVLVVSSQPMPSTIYIKDNTKAIVGFEIPGTSMPTTGIITVGLTSSNPSIATVPASCTISQASDPANNTCQSVSISPGTNTGVVTITASAANFESVTSNSINVKQDDDGPTFTLNTTGLTNNNIVAGQRFNIQIINDSNISQEVFFSTASSNSNTVNTISYSAQSCLVSNTEPCTTVVSINLKATAETYETNVTDASGNIIGIVKFAVSKPALSVILQPTALNFLNNDSQQSVGFGINPSSIPVTDSGTINVNISSGNSINLNKTTCSINYSGGAITSNSCNPIVLTATIYPGTTTIDASAQDFMSTSTLPITNPNSLAYFLSAGDIVMYRESGDGNLTPVYPQNIVQTDGTSTGMVVGLTAKYLYTIESSNTIQTYPINQVSGQPMPALSSTPIQGAPAGSTPNTIILTPDKHWLYVINSSSTKPQNRLISSYSIDIGSGRLTPQQTSTPFNQPVGMTFFQKQLGSSLYAYVITQGTGNNAVTQYSVNSSGGLTRVGNGVQLDAAPISITMDPTSRYLYIATVNNTIYQYAIKQNSGNLASLSKAKYNKDISAPLAVNFAPNSFINSQLYINSLSSVARYNTIDGAIQSSLNTPIPIYPNGANFMAFNYKGQYTYISTLVADSTNHYNIYQFSVESFSQLVQPIVLTTVPIIGIGFYTL